MIIYVLNTFIIFNLLRVAAWEWWSNPCAQKYPAGRFFRALRLKAKSLSCNKVYFLIFIKTTHIAMATIAVQNIIQE